MKRRWVIVAISSIVLIGAGTLVQTARKNRQLAKDATAFRIRAEQGDAEAQFKLGVMYSKREWSAERLCRGFPLVSQISGAGGREGRIQPLPHVSRW